MAIFLLILIYIAFIGLGLPDSLFGTAWPAIYADFGLPLSFGSFVSVVVTTGTILSALVSARLIRRFGTNKIAAVSTLLTAVALLGYSFSPNIWFMILLAIPLGFGAGCIDVALNNYVAVHYSATVMSFLHCFYGIGVTVSPYILSLVLSDGNGWRTGYGIAAGIQIGIAVLLFATLPVWKKVHPEEDAGADAAKKTLTLKETLAIKGVKSMCTLFFLSCAIECVTGGWGSTFLVEYRHLTTDRAAVILFVYFLGMTTGRFLSGLLATKWQSWRIVGTGLVILGLGIGVLFIPGPAFVFGIGFFLIGFGNGPLFPNLNYLAPKIFGMDVSESVIGAQMAFAYVGILVGPLLCGLIGQFAGMFIFPIYLMILFITMAVIAWKCPKARASSDNS